MSRFAGMTPLPFSPKDIVESLPEKILSGFNSDDGKRRAVQKVLDEFVKAESPIFRKIDPGYILFGQPS
jgi:hypothetical protein